MNLPADFSVFELVQPTHQGNILMNDPTMLLSISHKVEKRLLLEKTHGDLYVGFQTVSRFLKQEVLYRQLATQLHRLFIFAHPDVPFPAIKNITFVPIKAQDKLYHERFLIFHSLSYFTALASIERPEQVFAGIWTFDLNIIKTIAERLSRAIDATTPFFPENAYDQQSQLEMLQLHIKDLLDNSLEDKTNTGR